MHAPIHPSHPSKRPGTNSVLTNFVNKGQPGTFSTTTEYYYCYIRPAYGVLLLPTTTTITTSSTPYSVLRLLHTGCSLRLTAHCIALFSWRHTTTEYQVLLVVVNSTFDRPGKTWEEHRAGSGLTSKKKRG